jgi:hypothetical protein
LTPHRRESTTNSGVSKFKRVVAGVVVLGALHAAPAFAASPALTDVGSDSFVVSVNGSDFGTYCETAYKWGSAIGGKRWARAYSFVKQEWTDWIQVNC